MAQENNLKSNEFNSYTSAVTYSSYNGFNLLDYYSKEQLENIVKRPMAHNQLLREISKILYSTNGTYTNTVDYMVAMPTLDKVIVPHGKSNKNKSKNKELMEATLRTIKDKEIVRDALWRGMIDGIAFYYFETNGKPKAIQKTMDDFDVENIVDINEYGINASIISLPTDYTRIIGIKNNSYVIAFDLEYFTSSDNEPADKKIKKFPKEIREAYAKRFKDGKLVGKNWVILDNNKTIVHKIRSSRSEKYGRPLVLAAISDILYDDYFTSTKRNVLDEINNKVVYETFPEGKDKGKSSLTQQQQQKQHDSVKNAVTRKNNRGSISFFSVAAGTKLNSLDVNNADILDEKYESNLGDKIALDLGFAASLLNGSSKGSYSSQQANIELITAQIFQWIEQISAELNKCISANIIKDKKNWVEVNYLPITHVNKQTMINSAKDLYLQGRGSLALWASACGIRSDIFFALLDEELENGINEKYPVHATSFTLSKEDAKAGRPETDNPAESTVIGRGNGGNDLPSPTDNKS